MGIPNLEVLGPEIRMSQLFDFFRLNLLEIARTVSYSLRRVLQRPVQSRCNLSFFIAEIQIARAHGQTIVLSASGTRHDLDRETQIRGHVPDDEKLLVVFGAKYREIRSNEIE
jgi:hypothetical protein